VYAFTIRVTGDQADQTTDGVVRWRPSRYLNPATITFEGQQPRWGETRDAWVYEWTGVPVHQDGSTGTPFVTVTYRPRNDSAGSIAIDGIYTKITTGEHGSQHYQSLQTKIADSSSRHRGGPDSEAVTRRTARRGPLKSTEELWRIQSWFSGLGGLTPRWHLRAMARRPPVVRRTGLR
jgi:hypothetical protein